jgi:hypothetical protein
MFLRELGGAAPCEVAAAEEGLALAKASVHELAFTTDTADASVTVDGQTVGRTPLAVPIFLKPGMHTIEARKGERSATSRIEATAGSSTALDLRLTKPDATPPPGPAAPAAATPRQPTQGDDAPLVEADFDSGGGREPFFAWLGSTPGALVTTGIAVVGIGVGIGFGLDARRKYRSADDIGEQIEERAAFDGRDDIGICLSPPTNQYREACDAYTEEEEAGNDSRTIAAVGFAVGGAALATTIVYYFLDSDSGRDSARRPSPAVGWSPWVSPDGGGVSIRGSL